MTGITYRKGTLAAGTALKLGVIVSCFLGIFLQITAKGGSFMSSAPIFLYFTIQSNIWIAVICAVFLIADLARKGRGPVAGWLYVLKFMFTVSVLLTFVVFAVLLAPLMPRSYLLSPSNIFLHDITPILALLDFILFDYRYTGRGRHMFFGTIMPLGYGVFVLLLSRLAGVRFNGAAAPYFFLDYEKLGWFRIGPGGPGVAYWFAMIALVVLGIGFTLLKIKEARRRKKTQPAGGIT